MLTKIVSRETRRLRANLGGVGGRAYQIAQQQDKN